MLINNIIEQATEIINLPEPVPILLVGETGTGKSRAAQQIHEKSSRHTQPFVTVECGGLAPTLLKSTLFGHVKGSFTDATKDQLGKFGAANDGTIFLDEIDCFPLELQAYLLRIVDRGEYEAIGSNQTQQFAGRIIAATNRDLTEPGIFRSDLYYRLNAFQYQIPPLRETIELLEPLIIEFTREFVQKFNKPCFTLPLEIVDILYQHTWPGNIRQLRNCLQWLIATSSNKEQLQQHLNINHQEPFPVPMKKLTQARYTSTRNCIITTLTRCNGNFTQAAQELEISRVALYKAMKKHNI